MTQHEREVMQMAFEALESSRVFVTSREKIKHPEGTEWYDKRIEALRARLAQPEYAESTKEKHDEFVAMRNKSF